MNHIHADDGRILTPPKELKSLLKGAFPAFYKALGHIRFFYMADEIWNGESSLVFKTGAEVLAAVTLEGGAFCINVSGEDYRIANDDLLETVYEALRKNATPNQRRPKEQLDVNLDEYPNGVRCDLCQLYKGNNINDLSGCEAFRVMDYHCYYGVKEGWGEHKNSVDSSWICGGLQGCCNRRAQMSLNSRTEMSLSRRKGCPETGGAKSGRVRARPIKGKNAGKF